MKEKKSKSTANEAQKPGTGQAKKITAQKQKDAAAGEVQYGRTIGRHGTDEETNLNPEE